MKKALCVKMKTANFAGNEGGRSACLKQIPAKRTGRVVAGGKPLVEAGRVELLLAGPAGQFRQLMAGAVQNEKANVTFLNTVEPFIEVLLPDGQAVHDGTILMLQESCQLKHPETIEKTIILRSLLRPHGILASLYKL
jgi:hypothetical protein